MIDLLLLLALFSVAAALGYATRPGTTKLRKIVKSEREADLLLLEADPEFARSLGIVVPPSPLPTLRGAARALAVLPVTVAATAAEATRAFTRIGRAIEEIPRLPRRGNLSIPPPGIEVPPISRFG